jgi:hypothetical protein
MFCHSEPLAAYVLSFRGVRSRAKRGESVSRNLLLAGRQQISRLRCDSQTNRLLARDDPAGGFNTSREAAQE